VRLTSLGRRQRNGQTLERSRVKIFLLRGFIGALPDLNAQEQDIVADENTVVLRFVVEATHPKTRSRRPNLDRGKHLEPSSAAFGLPVGDQGRHRWAEACEMISAAGIIGLQHALIAYRVGWYGRGRSQRSPHR